MPDRFDALARFCRIMVPSLILLFVLLSVLVGIKDIGVTIMMWTLGFGFPLLFAPTPIPYLLAISPLCIVNRWPFLTLSLSSIAAGAVAFAPGLIVPDIQAPTTIVVRFDGMSSGGFEFLKSPLSR